MKSFFSKEDELLHQPQAVPEAASEVFEHPSQEPTKIVEKPLPPETKQDLPFSPDQLRDALHKKQETEKPTPKVEEPVHEELHDFETVLEDVPSMHSEPKEVVQQPHTGKGFFDEFAQYNLHETLDVGGKLEGNVLDKMKEFHNHMQEKNEYIVYTNEVKESINRKLSELQTLEHEWFHTQQQLDTLGKGMTDIEKTIQERSKELKSLVGEAKTRTRLEKQTNKGEEFVLQDGRLLTSLLDLRVALATMPDDVFRHHVNGKRNDFSLWIGGTLGDTDLAEKTKDVTDKRTMQTLLEK